MRFVYGVIAVFVWWFLMDILEKVPTVSFSDDGYIISAAIIVAGVMAGGA